MTQWAALWAALWAARRAARWAALWAAPTAPLEGRARAASAGGLRGRWWGLFGVAWRGGRIGVTAGGASGVRTPSKSGGVFSNAGGRGSRSRRAPSFATASARSRTNSAGGCTRRGAPYLALTWPPSKVPPSAVPPSAVPPSAVPLPKAPPQLPSPKGGAWNSHITGTRTHDPLPSGSNLVPVYRSPVACGSKHTPPS